MASAWLLGWLLAGLASTPAAGGGPTEHAGPGASPDSVAVAAVLRQEYRSMWLSLHGPAAAVFPLFGPVREAEWAVGWEPKFIAPVPAAQNPDGAVFTTRGRGGDDNIWVMTTYDPVECRVAYVVVRPGLVTCEIRIHVVAFGPAASSAEVWYRYTALTAAGNDFIERWLAHFPAEAPHWEDALNGRLLGTSSRPTP